MNLNIRLIVKIIGVVSVVFGGMMLPCLIIAAIFAEYDMLQVFFGLFIVLLLIGLILYKIPWKGKRNSNNIRMREGLLAVTLCWIIAAMFGALPYIVSGVMPSYIDAFFESVSGLTTTGLTLIPDFAVIPRSLLFWRSLSIWIGGMGILVFAITVLPALGIGTQNLANAETTGPTVEKLRSRMADNAKILYMIYIAFTAVEFILLLAGPMDAYEAIIHTFGSMGNCGISTETAGVVHFQSLYIETVIAVFCILASLNFASYQLILQKRFKDFFRDFEIRTFFMILGISMLLITLVLWAKGTYGGLGDTIRHGFFQIISFVTTAGYNTTDYEVWPEFTKWLLFITIIIGGCSSSTAGGIKVIRFGIMLGLLKRNIYKRLHPNAVVAVKFGGKPISTDKVSNVAVFLMVYMLIFFGSSLLLSLDGNDPVTTASAVMASLSNAGLGFGKIGFGHTMEVFSIGSRMFLSLLMIMGRLEIFTVLLLFTPAFWRPNR